MVSLYGFVFQLKNYLKLLHIVFKTADGKGLRSLAVNVRERTIHYNNCSGRDDLDPLAFCYELAVSLAFVE